MPIDLSTSLILRWPDPDPEHVPVLRQAGINAVVLDTPHAAFSSACSAAGIDTVTAAELEFVKVGELGKAAGANVVLTNGTWPGIAKPPAVEGRGDETASASREPWVDSNGYWIAWLRALYPKRPAVLGHVPELGDRGVPYDTLDLALIEAWVAGGNYILAVEPYYRQSLLRNDPKAVAAWKNLGRTAAWLKQNVETFRQPSLPIVTALVDPGAASAEIANLLYRRNASPSLYPVAAPPEPAPRARLALVAANLRSPEPATAKRILAHAEAGTSLVVAGREDWWKTPALKSVRSEEDRDFYSVGSGRVIAYKKPVMDPSEFALDVIDVVTHRQRAVRLWNAPSVIAVATASPRPKERLMHLVNYGKPIDTDVQARVQGNYESATLIRPDGDTVTLKPAKRGSSTEVLVPELTRLGVIIFR